MRFGILTHSNNDRQVEQKNPEMAESNSLVYGKKEETGSIRNNKPFISSKDSVPSRFLTETAENFRFTNNSEFGNSCSSISRTGFTLCNKSDHHFSNIEREREVFKY
jgi:hypothetical protein